MNEPQAAEPTPERAGKPTDAWIILLPPGWARFPTGEGLQRELNDAIEQVFVRALPDSLPRDKVEPYRHLLRDERHKTLGEAREAGTGAVYLPTEPMETLPLFCLAAASTSRKSLYGCATLATIAIGEVPTSITLERSRSVSNGMLGSSDGFTAWVSNTRPKV